MVEINNLTQSPIKEPLVKKLVETILEKEGYGKTSEVSIAFVGPGRIRKINKMYRGKNRATDVLSFPELKVPISNFKVFRPQKTQGLGEIIICLREVKKNSQKEKRPFGEELIRVLIHGVLHLLGYDHEKAEKQAKEMATQEELYLGLFAS